MNSNLIITVTRQRGAGGTKIARSVAKILEIPCYSKEAFMVKDESGKKHLIPRDEIRKTIKNNAPCVAIGLCADYIISDKNATYLSVYIKASKKKRKANLINEYETDSLSAERILKSESHMKNHFEKYTGLKWGSSKSFDLVFNTGRIRRDEAIRTICEVALSIINSENEN